jgi:hypothetical protein
MITVIGAEDLTDFQPPAGWALLAFGANGMSPGISSRYHAIVWHSELPAPDALPAALDGYIARLGGSKLHGLVVVLECQPWRTSELVTELALRLLLNNARGRGRT